MYIVINELKELRFTYRRLHLIDANANEYDGSVLLHSKGQVLIEPISNYTLQDIRE